ncbi:hypothetical protein [Sphingomonas sp. CFBP 13706]|uniref:hypothetical protein n=1 Tax=Sphingomonas sp. CFBP 13706 TaxID=2775314 RepID=UPI00178607AF|nr:hypothetical protein [Sphingomonas sp. CFBP 13706]MBD8737844.1 hypothetical protein [Sphingomonas sp. CFBP 13706]
MAHTAPNSPNPEIANAPEWTPSGTEHTSWYRHPSITATQSHVRGWDWDWDWDWNWDW